MKNKKKKRKNSKQFNKQFKKRFFTLKSGVLLGLTFLIFLLISVGWLHQRKKAAVYQEQIEELNSEVADLEETNKSLEEKKENVDSDEFKEQIARERLGMVGKDEYVLEESDEEPEEKTTEESEEATTEASAEKEN